MNKTRLFSCFFAILLVFDVYGNDNVSYNTSYQLKAQEAIAFIDSAAHLKPSTFWPSVNVNLFIHNLRRNVQNPETIYQGRYTNFCGYAALTYLLVMEDPVLYANNLIGLFRHGTVKYGKKLLAPGLDVRLAAGTLVKKGALDSLHADQLWFLCLADQFKGYVNFFDKYYNRGDENRLWAGVNYGKFNRMAKILMGRRMECLGNDIRKPYIEDLSAYLQQKLHYGSVVLMTNSRIKDHPTKAPIKLRLPVHFIVLQFVEVGENSVTMGFWDYGGYKVRKFSKERLRKAVCGVSTVMSNEIYAGTQ